MVYIAFLSDKDGGGFKKITSLCACPYELPGPQICPFLFYLLIFGKSNVSDCVCDLKSVTCVVCCAFIAKLVLITILLTVR